LPFGSYALADWLDTWALSGRQGMPFGTLDKAPLGESQQEQGPAVIEDTTLPLEDSSSPAAGP
jgi:hypothetical protein